MIKSPSFFFLVIFLATGPISHARYFSATAVDSSALDELSEEARVLWEKKEKNLIPALAFQAQLTSLYEKLNSFLKSTWISPSGSLAHNKISPLLRNPLHNPPHPLLIQLLFVNLAKANKLFYIPGWINDLVEFESLNRSIHNDLPIYPGRTSPERARDLKKKLSKLVHQKDLHVWDVLFNTINLLSRLPLQSCSELGVSPQSNQYLIYHLIADSLGTCEHFSRHTFQSSGPFQDKDTFGFCVNSHLVGRLKNEEASAEMPITTYLVSKTAALCATDFPAERRSFNERVQKAVSYNLDFLGVKK